MRDGRLRGIAVSERRRLPDLPTFAELGWPAPESGTWHGVFAARPMPEPVVARLDAAFGGASTEPGVGRRMTDLGADIRAEGPGACRRWLAAETKAWGRVVGETGIKLDGMEQLLSRLAELGVEARTVAHPPLFTVADSRALRG